MIDKTLVEWAKQPCPSCAENPDTSHACVRQLGPAVELAIAITTANKVHWENPHNIVAAAKTDIDDYIASIGLSGQVIGYAVGDWRPTDLPNDISPLAIVPNRAIAPTARTMSIFIAIDKSLGNVLPQRDMNTRQAAVQQLMNPIPLYRVPLMSAGLVSEQAAEIVRNYSKPRALSFKIQGVSDSALPSIYTLNTNLLDILDRLDPSTLQYVVRL